MAEKPAITIPARAQDLSGRRFGRLAAIAYAGKRGQQSLWLCLCDCGVTHTAYATNLVRGLTQSCGCRRTDPSVHGQSISKNQSEYNSWRAMIHRCIDPAWDGFENYGGRGITVCERWQNGESTHSGFDCFLCDMGKKPAKRHTIDRIDNGVGYAPANCRWAAMKTQQNNKRSNVRLTVGGITKNLSEWADAAGMCPITLRGRLKRGWKPEDAIKWPL